MKELYLLPVTLGEIDPRIVLPLQYFDIINDIDCFIVENIRTARRFLIKCGIKKEIDSINFILIDKHSTTDHIFNEISQRDFIRYAILSEAGVPCVADPGSKIVLWAHHNNFRVIPITGPSSIILALMASGLNGQNFVFHGYLPIKKEERIKKIKQIEKDSYQKNQSQIFIETPYRNNNIYNDLINYCNPETHLCIASNITLENEEIKTKKIKEWKKTNINLDKKPTVFVLQLL